MSKTTGRVTLPSEAGLFEETKEIMTRWGADALRNSDGTHLSDDLKSLNAKIYTTYFVSRGYNEHAQKHLDERQQIYLLSRPAAAVSETLGINIMEEFFHQQVEPDYDHDPKRFWEVVDRTAGVALPAGNWDYERETNTVTIAGAQKFHEYTVSFLAYCNWDPTQMYNHIMNSWDRMHDIPFDVRRPNSAAFIEEHMREWLKENPDTDVVRFTTFFYHFMLVYDNKAREKFVDWFGYGSSISAAALEAFEREFGYALRPEDIVDCGYYNNPFRVPGKAFLDYMDFVQRFVAQKAGRLVDMVHQAGKEAMMFLGDNWIGTEPYGKYFKDIGLDAVVGSVGSGATLRLISDIPHVKYTEGRFLPYFFPDSFREGNDPCVEAIDNWLCARRAIMRKPVDRIGYGGYLSLACKFPKFVDLIERVCDEFREIYANIAGSRPYSALRVAVLNCWGSLRSWQAYMVAHAMMYKQNYSYLGVLEALSGAAVDVRFISFDDIRREGVPADVDVIINAGDEGTAYSGGSEWLDAEVSSRIREWIYNGGGFIGVGEPSAVQHGGRFFQLAGALGVDMEKSFSLSCNKYYNEPLKSHFISEDASCPIDFGESKKNVYALGEDTQIIEASGGDIRLACNVYGSGRSVYIAGLPYSAQNSRLLLRSLYYAAGKEDALKVWFASNPECEVHAYPEMGKYAVINNSNVARSTLVYDGGGVSREVSLEPMQIIWEAIK